MSKFEDKNLSTGESKPNYYEGNKSRQAQEKDEGLKTVDNSTAPDTRYSTSQQISEVDKATNTETPKTGFSKKKVSAGGSALKQEVASKLLISDSDYAGVPGGASASMSRSGLKSLSYSGDAGSILGSAANTPVVGKPSRSDGRFEKKLDATSKKINYLASEQVLTEYMNPKPLGESADEKQGYYGTPKNTSVRSQKSAGGTPANMLVERSADEISKDELVFVAGQYVKSTLGQSGVYDVEPTKTTEFIDGVRTEINLDGENGNDPIKYGNYLNRKVDIVLSKGDKGTFLKSMTFESVDCSKEDETDATVNAASTNWLIDMNNDEICRQNIDSKAGRETELNWSPLGRAILEPTATVGLLRRIEMDLGANYFTAYKFAKKAHAYQLNKAAKDGQRTTTPMREMLTGDISANISSQDYSDGDHYNGYDSIFNAELYKKGSAALLIDMFDSKGKYKDKADILLQPRSLRRAFQIADNNMDVFRLKPEFAAALNAVDVFSTIDREYDPLLPVCITDKVGLISPISYARFGNFTRSAAGQPRVYTSRRFKYSYSNRSSNYEINVGHPMLDGLADFIEQHAALMYERCGGKTGDITITIPLVSSTTTFSLWDFILLYATPFVQKNRINSMRDVLDFEVNFEYPLNLTTIKELNPMNALNYNITDIDEPLQCKRMIPSTAIQWTMPEFFWNVGTAGDSKWLTVMPWYFNELQFKPNAANEDGAEGFTQDYMSGIMSMPVIRNGVRLGYLDNMYDMSERDIRLCLDRLVRHPLGSESEDQYNVYKYGQANEGIPCMAGRFTIKDLISTPRELGWFMTAPYGVIRNADNLIANATKFGYEAFAPMSDYVNGNTSFRIRCWKGIAHVTDEILTASDVNISRAQAFRQYWDCSPAAYMLDIGAEENDTYRARKEIGFLVSMKQCFANSSVTKLELKENQGSFIPFTVGKSANSSSIQPQSADSELKVVALHKGLWGRLQRLPMVISPWDTCDFMSGTGANYDPYDFAYMFGFAGMMASDYNQDLYDRTNQVQDQGWLYVEDPFVHDSPIFKDSNKYTIDIK